MNTEFCSQCDGRINKVNISVNILLKVQFFIFYTRWEYLRKQIFSLSLISLLTAFCVCRLFVLPEIISFEEGKQKTKGDILFCDFRVLWPYYPRCLHLFVYCLCTGVIELNLLTKTVPFK